MGFWEIFALIMGSTGFFLFLQFLIQRHDDRKGKIALILKKLDKNEKDNIRTQLLLMISDYPEERQEILTLAQYYFRDLKGNWYASSIFRKYLNDNRIEPPIWFNHN